MPSPSFTLDGPTALVVLYAGIGVVLLVLLHFVRVRLRGNHPKVYSSLGGPKYEGSNMGSAYWALQGFVWFRHWSLVRDGVLHALCMLVAVGEVAVLVLFALPYAAHW